MLLTDLLNSFEHSSIKGDTGIEVTDIVYDSRKASPGSMFVCIKGYVRDGHKYAAEAYAAGARSFIVSDAIELPCDAAIISTNDCRLALSRVSARFYGHPAQKLLTVGITGTKGKTSSSYMIKSILEKSGYNVGIIGTNGIHYDGCDEMSENSTPESCDIHRHLAGMIGCGCNAAVIEVTSQAFKLHRAADLSFDISLFTNMGNDHVGGNEHSDFNEYLACKKMIFDISDKVVVNRDTDHYDEIIAGVKTPYVTFGFSDGAEYRGEHPDYSVINHRYTTSFFCRSGHGLHRYELGIPGRVSVENALGAAALAREIGISFDAIRTGLRTAVVYGRMEILPDTGDVTVIIDYAHNEMSMRSLFDTVRLYSPRRVICVFGAGGNRSRVRRFDMGRAAGELADLSVITSDNPRFEKLDDIIADILTGLLPTGGEHVVVKDRGEAIRYALSTAQPGDTVLLCGKGQQDFEEVNGIKTHFDEREKVREYFYR